MASKVCCRVTRQAQQKEAARSCWRQALGHQKENVKLAPPALSPTNRFGNRFAAGAPPDWNANPNGWGLLGITGIADDHSRKNGEWSHPTADHCCTAATM